MKQAIFHLIFWSRYSRNATTRNWAELKRRIELVFVVVFVVNHFSVFGRRLWLLVAKALWESLSQRYRRGRRRRRDVEGKVHGILFLQMKTNCNELKYSSFLLRYVFTFNLAFSFSGSLTSVMSAWRIFLSESPIKLKTGRHLNERPCWPIRLPRK